MKQHEPVFMWHDEAWVVWLTQEGPNMSFQARMLNESEAVTLYDRARQFSLIEALNALKTDIRKRRTREGEQP